jgi:acyl-CoA thioesterase-1
MTETAAPFILAFGDSLTAGHGLVAQASLPSRLQVLLAQRWPGATVQNAGISGNTTVDAVRRMPRVLAALTRKPDLAIIEFGANDVLRQIAPAQTRANLDTILDELGRCGIPVLLATFAPPPFLARLAQGYAAIYDDLARKHGVATVPFFPPGMLGHPEMVLPDRVHPNARAIDLIAHAMLPAVIAALETAPRAAA